jgi:26S proteasome regulatory subunit N6
MSNFAKAKTAKIGFPIEMFTLTQVRALIDLFSAIPNTTDTQIEVTKDCISWAVTEKRTFMRLSLQTRLVGLYLESQKYHDALQLSTTLLKELRRLDDKMVLVEVQLLESRVYHALRNIPKSRASLTSARTAANAIYCPPIVQAGLDMQSGILLAEDKDFKTAYGPVIPCYVNDRYSYFYEALEGYNSQDDPRAIMALKYMLLSKVMLNLTDDVYSTLNHLCC